MKLKLKDEPKEWLKFIVVMGILAGVVAGLLYHRKLIGAESLAGVGIVIVLTVVACALWPRCFRGFYRAGMTISFRIGQTLGWLWLTFFFLLVLTPLGLMLRAVGKDLLEMRRRKTDTYWHTARRPGDYDRQF